jgi:hypothetical protein
MGSRSTRDDRETRTDRDEWPSFRLEYTIQRIGGTEYVYIGRKGDVSGHFSP